MQISSHEVSTPGRPVITTLYSNEEAFSKLGEIAEKKSNDFIDSLLKTGRKGRLSSCQKYWVHKIVMDAEKPEALKIPAEKVWEIFLNALESGLKYPKISLPFSCVISWSPSKGTCSVRIRGKISDYVGKLHKDGFFIWRDPAELPDGFLEMLREFCADPKKFGATYGIETGNCCFCSRELTTTESVSVGYGPICATRWGLPWGFDKKTAQLRKLKEKMREFNAE